MKPVTQRQPVEPRRRKGGKRPRSRGNRFELVVRDMLREQGWRYATRNWQSGGQGGGDIINGPNDFHLECKCHERADFPGWLAQATGEARVTDVPCVVFSRNREGLYALLPWDELEPLLKLYPGKTFRRDFSPSSRWRVWDWLAITEASCDGALPVTTFRRPDEAVWGVVDFSTLLGLLWDRENA